MPLTRALLMLLERNLPKEHANNAQNKHLQNKPRPRTLTHTDFLKRHILDYQTKKTSVRKHALCCSIVKLLKRVIVDMDQ